jgi:hypothetical protein
MLDPGAVTRLRGAIASVGGGYLRNPVRKYGVTCTVCLTPVAGFGHCYTCHAQRSHAGLADAIGFLTYAIAGTESGYVMRGYKARPPVAESRMIAGLLLILTLHEHMRCAGVMAGVPFTHWAIVPSLPAKPGEHPLRSLVASHAPGNEVALVAASSVQRPREVDATHFVAEAQLPRRTHVMLIDDTWTSGGHAQSAVLALRRSGASKVSVLVVARWLKANFAGNRELVSELARHDYDPGKCPWTSGTCPTAS